MAIYKYLQIDALLRIKKWNRRYPNHFKMQGLAGIRNVLGKALIEENGYSGEYAYMDFSYCTK